LKKSCRPFFGHRKILILIIYPRLDYFPHTKKKTLEKRVGKPFLLSSFFFSLPHFKHSFCFHLAFGRFITMDFSLSGCSSL
jgi:hypothetical protein